MNAMGRRIIRAVKAEKAVRSLFHKSQNQTDTVALLYYSLFQEESPVFTSVELETETEARRGGSVCLKHAKLRIILANLFIESDTETSRKSRGARRVPALLTPKRSQSQVERMCL